MTNPFLSKKTISHDINFADIKTEHFKEAFDVLLVEAKDEFENIVTQEPTFKILLEGQEKDDQLSMLCKILYNYNAVIQTPEIRDVYEEYMPKVAEFSEVCSKDIRGYNQYKKFILTQEYENLDELKKKAINKIIKNYERSGIHLPEDKKNELKENSMKLSELTTQFNNNITDTEASFELKFTKEELQGLPQRNFDDAEKVMDNGVEKYLMTYSSGAYSDILSYCDVEETRKQVYEQMLENGIKDGKDNRPLMKEIVNLYQNLAKILGYKNASEFLLEDNMAKTVDNTLDFINKLSSASFEAAKSDSESVHEFGKAYLNKKELNFHDIQYVIEKMRKEKFSINSEEHREYFPVSKVISGMFDLIEKIYEVKFKEVKGKTLWHEDATCYAVYDMNTNEEIGSLYMDLYKRKFKSTGAWMYPMVTRSVTDDEKVLPVVYLVCNSQKSNEQESTFEFDDIITIYHEMGHALHNLLSEVDFKYYSGLGQVQHDAVELPSQFMENFCWDYDVLKSMSSHIKTGEVFPKEEFDKMLAAKNFLSASGMLGQSKRSEMDVLIYSNLDSDPEKIEEEIEEKWKVGKKDPRKKLLPTFKHIFSWGYNSGYYAYAWAEVLSADAYAALKEQGSSYAEQKEMAQKFRKNILAVGGKDSMDINFINFRGRSPDVNYLLESYGVNPEVKKLKKQYS